MSKRRSNSDQALGSEGFYLKRLATDGVVGFKD